MRLTRRIDLDLGKQCNARCAFCYYRHSLNLNPPPSFDLLKKRLDYLRRHDIDTLDLTGGEPTIEKDFFQIAKYIKQHTKVKHISVITNGLFLADENFVKKMKECGIDDVLFSLHGHNDKIHDMLTGTSGSFKKLIRAIENANKHKITARVNTVITNYNYEYVKVIGALLSKFKIYNWNLITCNPILDASNLSRELVIEYTKSAPFIKGALEKLSGAIQSIFIKDMPYCLMRGYERNVINIIQANYLPNEWNFLLRTRMRRGNVLTEGATLLGLLMFTDIRNIFCRDIEELRHDAFIYFQEFMNKKKPFRCLFCRYDLICPGVWKNYFKLYGDRELYPVKGEKILKPYYFMEGHGRKT